MQYDFSMPSKYTGRHAERFFSDTITDIRECNIKIQHKWLGCLVGPLEMFFFCRFRYT